MGRPPLAIGQHGNIQKRTDDTGLHIAETRVRDHTGKVRRVMRTGKSDAAAGRALQTAIADVLGSTGQAELTPNMRVKTLADRWLADLDVAHNSERVYRLTVQNHIIDALGDYRLREVTVQRVDAALTAIKETSGLGSAKTARSVLSGMFGYAARKGALSGNPVRDVSSISRKAKKTVRALTADEADQITDTLRTRQRPLELDVPDLIDFLLGTGCRIGEACAIRDDCLDLEAGTVEINATVIRIQGTGLVIQERPKTAAGWRVLALPPSIVDMLHRRKTELRAGKPQDVLCLTEDDSLVTRPEIGVAFTSPLGKLRDPSNTSGDLRDTLDDITDDDGQQLFHWVTAHTFRKTVATRMDEAGCSAREIADQLGHEKPSLTQDYYMGRRVVSAKAAQILER